MVTDTLSSQSCEMTIDLGAIAENYRILKKHLGETVEVAAVVKSDAYGLGVKKILAALENQDCPFYYVARPEEAFDLRQLTPRPIGIMNGPYKGLEDLCLRHNVMPVLSTLSDIELFQALAKRFELKVGVALHADTGMNRLGLEEQDLKTLIDHPEKLEGLDVKMLHSHFACADDPEHSKNEEQLALFETLSKQFPNAKKSFGNSSGLFLPKKYHFDQVRPGMALYGLNPVPQFDNPMKPVIRVNAKVLQVKKAYAGQTAGYGATHIFKEDREIAILGIGYSNGLHRTLGNKGMTYYKGQPCPMIGRISMDLLTVDVTDTDQKPKQGDRFEIIGAHQSVDDLAQQAGTIGYEILTSLGPRLHKKYVYHKSQGEEIIPALVGNLN